MLSVTILPSIYAHICQISLTWVFKAIFPIFLVITALFAYEIGSSITHNSKMGFLSAFLIMANDIFFLTLTEVAKQEVAYLFIGAIILLMLNKKIAVLPQRILLILFIVGLTVSHYSSVYIFILLAVAVQILRLIFARIAYFKTSKDLAIVPKNMAPITNCFRIQNLMF